MVLTWVRRGHRDQPRRGNWKYSNKPVVCPPILEMYQINGGLTPIWETFQFSGGLIPILEMFQINGGLTPIWETFQIGGGLTPILQFSGGLTPILETDLLADVIEQRQPRQRFERHLRSFQRHLLLLEHRDGLDHVEVLQVR